MDSLKSCGEVDFKCFRDIYTHTPSQFLVSTAAQLMVNLNTIDILLLINYNIITLSTAFYTISIIIPPPDTNLSLSHSLRPLVSLPTLFFSLCNLLNPP